MDWHGLSVRIARRQAWRWTLFSVMVLSARLMGQDVAIPVIPSAPPLPQATAPNSSSIPAESDASQLPETVVEGGRPAEPTPEANLPSSLPSQAQDAAPQGLFQGMIGQSVSASSGFAGQSDFQSRPFWRGADVVEIIPNLFANEHAGGGKATEFFLRGVPMFHGTDFSIFLDGVPLNLPSHAHGQGYADINFIIPETIEVVEFRKGPYYADVGDFSSVATAAFKLVRKFNDPFAKVEGGMYDYYRLVNAATYSAGGGDMTYAFETRFFGGPWTTPDQLHKFNGYLKWTRGDDDSWVSVTAQGYNNQWTNTNQIPEYVVQQGATRFTNLSPTDGGVTNRYGLNAQVFHEHDDGSITTADVFSYFYDFDLYANYTFFLDDPVNGDQINQRDARVVSGTRIQHQWSTELLDTEVKHTAGVWFRNDAIPMVNLDHTAERALLNPVGHNRIYETTFAGYYSNELIWCDKLRTVQGFRYDQFLFDVRNYTTPENTGSNWAGLPQPKFTAILGPWNKSEFFFNYGMGFHSNDARGVTQTVTTDDNGALVPTSSVLGLIQTEGGEFGFRSSAIENLNISVAAFYLKMDSELLFEGDTGTTLPTAATERWGVEWNNFYAITDWWFLDGEYSATQSRYSTLNVDDETVTQGYYIPTAPNLVATAGTTVKFTESIFATLRYRYFGPRPLTNDNSQRSSSTDLFNLRLGYQGKKLACGLDLLNVLNSKDPEISYFYATALQGQAAQFSRVNHPLLPFQWRMYLSYSY